MPSSKIENIKVYRNIEVDNRPKWGEQWDEKLMDYLLEIGPLKFFQKMLAKKAEEPCLVLGASWHDQSIVSPFFKRIIGVNISLEELRKSKNMSIEYEWMVCDGENLPFKNSVFKNVISKSFLHHVDPVKELKEIKRVTSKKGFLFLWEPGRYNLIAAVGRKFFPTRDHVSSEEPFDPSVLRELTLNYFGTIIYEEYFFINTVILPVLAKHCKLFKSKKLMSILVKFDGFLCRSFFKKFSWIIIIGAQKG